MQASTVARSYAEALLELAERHQALEECARAFEVVSELIRGEPRLRAFLDTPKIEAEARKRVLRKGLEGRVPPLFLNFLLVVLDKRRQRLLDEIGAAYRALLDEKLGLLNVQVTVAHELDAKARDDVAQRLSRVLGRRVIPHVRTDPDILGGIVVRYGDRVLDGSLRRRLLGLRTRLLHAALPAGSAQ